MEMLDDDRVKEIDSEIRERERKLSEEKKYLRTLKIRKRAAVAEAKYGERRPVNSEIPIWLDEWFEDEAKRQGRFKYELLTDAGKLYKESIESKG